MSERTDRIIDDHLNQRPAARRAYQHDPTLRHQVEWARRLLAVMELVMQREGIAADAGERVLNEVMHVGLGDWEREKLSRERLLLLADMTADFRDDRPEPLTTEQVRGMWHDVMPVPDGPLRTETETFGEGGTGAAGSGKETSG